MSSFTRLLNVFRPRVSDRDLEDEVRFHLDRRTEDNLRLGMTLEQAEDDAYRRFGEIGRVKARMRAAHVVGPAALVALALAVSTATLGAWMLIERQSDRTVYSVVDGISPPVLLHIPKAEYTPLAKRAKVQGAVRLRCVVRPTGQCTDVVVVRSLDTRFGLDDEAVRAIREGRFRPATRNGSPVATRVDMEVRFALR